MAENWQNWDGEEHPLPKGVHVWGEYLLFGNPLLYENSDFGGTSRVFNKKYKSGHHKQTIGCQLVIFQGALIILISLKHFNIFNKCF